MTSTRGVALIEVLVAIAILSMVGVSSIALLTSTLDAHGRLHSREVELRRAERVLIATTLLARRELEQRIGRRDVGGFVVRVDRPEPSLFRVGVAPEEDPAAELVSTLIYRAATLSAAPDSTPGGATP
jgi:prepilin-type N-terminal cleavage/methylation domain-containing protein